MKIFKIGDLVRHEGMKCKVINLEMEDDKLFCYIMAQLSGRIVSTAELSSGDYGRGTGTIPIMRVESNLLTPDRRKRMRIADIENTAKRIYEETKQ